MRKHVLAFILFLSSLCCFLQSMDWATFKEMPVEIKLNIIKELLNNTTSITTLIHHLKTLRSIDKECNEIVSEENQFRPFFELSVFEDNIFNALALIKSNKKLLRYPDLAHYLSEKIGYLPPEMIQYGLDMLDPANQERFKIELNESFDIALHDCSRKSQWHNQDDIYKVFALLVCGADPNSKSYNKNTALIEAVYGRNDLMVKLLIDKGADVNAKGYFDFTPLEAAIRTNSIELIELLLLYGAHPNMKTSTDQPPLKWAIELSSLEVAELLLRFGANPNDEINKGFSLLLFAASKKDRDMMRLLIAYGADISPSTIEYYKSKIVAGSLNEKEKTHWEGAINFLEDFLDKFELSFRNELLSIEKNLSESLA